MSVNDLPAVNAALNTTSTVLLLIGYRFIRRGRESQHRACMLGALLTSVLFLASYLYYHAHAGRTVFADPAWFRPIYLTILLTHTVLAMAVPPLALITVYLALRDRRAAHKRIARWTWPIWLYVSITGVVIYLLLYQIFPQSPASTAETAGLLRPVSTFYSCPCS
jgi:uncharacterized membrane protein YozB (DUF420 family)